MRSIGSTNSATIPTSPISNIGQGAKRNIFVTVAPPADPCGAKSPIEEVNRGPNTPQTPGTPGTPGITDDTQESFVVPDSPASGVAKSGKRKRKQSISDNLKDDKYWERRRKNNAAAKRSREERMIKEAQIAQQANSLVIENQKLKAELQSALEANEELKTRLRNYENVP